MSLCEMLGIKLPILQSPMAGVQGLRLAAAVSGAGGLGAIPAAAYSPETLSKALMELQAQSTQPYNLNFFATLLHRKILTGLGLVQAAATGIPSVGH